MLAAWAPNGMAAWQLIRSGSPDSVEVWTVADAGHTGGLATEPDEWEERVIGFLDEHLSP